MRILVDTQCWLWMTSAPERFSRESRKQIEASGTELFLSAASAWEIAIKYALGRLQLPEPPFKYVPDRLRITRSVELPIAHVHALRAGELPAHHRDPFDRLLIAQAQIERWPLLTADRQLKAYDVDIIEA